MRKWLVVFMTVIAVGLAGVMVWLYIRADSNGPEIVVESGKNNVYSQDMTTEELLEDVKAVDEEDGDVSDTLQIENIYLNDKGDKVTVIYVAKDSSNNVTKFTYYMETDGEKDSEKAESEEKDQKKSDTSEEREESEDSDTPEESDEESEGEEEEPEENLTEEEQAQKREEEKISKLNPQDPKFYLTTYYVKIPRGTSIDRLSYVKDIEDDTDATNELYRKIQITGNVDVNTPGTYELTYYVVDSTGNASNGAVLTVVVE